MLKYLLIAQKKHFHFELFPMKIGRNYTTSITSINNCYSQALLIVKNKPSNTQILKQHVLHFLITNYLIDTSHLDFDMETVL